MTTLKKRILLLAVAAFAILLTAPRLLAQATDASLHGHVTNPAGFPQATGTVQITTDHGDPKSVKFGYTFPLSATGDYAGKGIAPGSYLAYVTQDGKFIDRLEIKLVAGDDKTLDFDMTREEYQKNLTPEEKKAIEDYKKANAANNTIANLNKTLTDVRADLKSPTPNYDKDIADMKQATTQKPEEGILWITLGDVLASSADHMAADVRKQGKTPDSDDATVKQYADAVDAYKKGIDLNVASKKPSPADQASTYNQMGTAYAHAGKLKEAQDAYEAAAKLVPANAGMYYGNEAAILYNASQTNAALAEGSLDAANKAIAADPDRPDPYFVKGQILLQKATLDPKTNKITPPDGCIDAYQTYLSLAPDGKFAASVKEVLAQLNIKVETHYHAGSKKH